MPTRKPAAQKSPMKDEVIKPVKVKEKAPRVKAAPESPKEVPPPMPAKAPAVGRKPKDKKAPEAEPIQVVQASAAIEPPAAPNPGVDPKALAVLDAINLGGALEFVFDNGEVNPPRTFEPRMLCFDALTRAWYAWGWDRRYNAERHHRLDLLKEINAVDGLGRAAQGPFKDGTPANLIGGWLGGEPIPVKAILMKQWIFAVKQAPPPFPAFLMEDIEDGKAQVSFTATDLRAIARWCMQFGDGIQVLEPQRLVDRIKQVGITWGGKPREAEAPRPAPPPPPPPPARHAAAPVQPRREQREPEEKPKGKSPRVEVRTERL